MNLHDAPAKREGQPITQYQPKKPEVETTYVERRVPIHLEDKAHELIDDLLVKNGYNPGE